jgi:hypothetical protein
VVPVFLLPRKLDPNFLFFLRQLDWRSGVKLHGESIPIAIIFFEWFSQMKIQQKVRLRKPYEKEDGCWQKGPELEVYHLKRWLSPFTW